jgi:hypothetical protein
LIANMRCRRAGVIASTRAPKSMTPALFTNPARGGRAWSIVANIACTWTSLATLAWTARARPPWASIAATTFSAAAASCV